MKEGIEDKGKGMRKIRNRALGCRRKASQGQGLPGNKVNPLFLQDYLLENNYADRIINGE